MKLEILQVPDCPNVELLERRIAEAMAGERVDVTITHRVLDDQVGAAEAGMTGSPTLLLDGLDPFAEPGLAPSVSCRLYRADGGGIDGAPSVAALRAAMNLASETNTIEAPTPVAALGAWRSAAQPAGPAEVAIHHTDRP